jgi:hypothetical protein
VGIDGRGSAFLETATADSENVAHAVSYVVDVVVTRQSSPDFVSLDYIIGDIKHFTHNFIYFLLTI